MAWSDRRKGQDAGRKNGESRASEAREPDACFAIAEDRLVRSSCQANRTRFNGQTMGLDRVTRNRALTPRRW